MYREIVFEDGKGSSGFELAPEDDYFGERGWYWWACDTPVGPFHTAEDAAADFRGEIVKRVGDCFNPCEACERMNDANG